MPHYYDDHEFAEIARVPVRRVRQWRRRGLLPFAVHPAGTRKTLYPMAAVHEWIEGRAQRSRTHDNESGRAENVADDVF